MTANWPHQDRAKEQIRKLRAEQRSTVLCVAPCGAGKSRIMQQLATEEVQAGGTVRIYLHRTMLREQLSRVFDEAGIDHGVMAMGVEPRPDAPVQICMMQSMYARAIQRSKWDLGNPSLVMVDEAHQQVGKQAVSILHGGISESGMVWDGHAKRGAFVIGYSATPVNCGNLYGDIVAAGTNAELRKVKAHLPVRVYSPSEIDCSGLQVNSDNEFNPRDLEPRSYAIMGDAYQWWKTLNPDAKPTVLFAPSVSASRWFANEWARLGVPVAHLDGATCLLPSRSSSGEIILETYDSTEEIRNTILEMSRTGDIKIICNRFVLREAIDMPWMYHGIGATAFGGVASYLQSVGRVQRFHPDYEFKIWQDHGGNYWRHGSPNLDREWNLGDTNRTIAKARIERIKAAEKPQDVEGICCPKCHCWRQHGVRCPSCGHSHVMSVRSVRMLDGVLKLQRGGVTPKKKKKLGSAEKIWTSVLYGSAQTDRAVSSAVAIWVNRCLKAGVHPDRASLKHPPPDPSSIDYHRSVRVVFPWLKPRGARSS